MTNKNDGGVVYSGKTERLSRIYGEFVDLSLEYPIAESLQNSTPDKIDIPSSVQKNNHLILLDNTYYSELKQELNDFLKNGSLLVVANHFGFTVAISSQTLGPVYGYLFQTRVGIAAENFVKKGFTFEFLASMKEDKTEIELSSHCRGKIKPEWEQMAEIVSKWLTRQYTEKMA